MNDYLGKTIDRYAAMMLEMLDINAKYHNMPRPKLVQKLVDDLWVHEQIKSQED